MAAYGMLPHHRLLQNATDVRPPDEPRVRRGRRLDGDRISSLMDVWFLLENLEEGRAHRGLSILKARMAPNEVRVPADECRDPLRGGSAMTASAAPARRPRALGPPPLRRGPHARARSPPSGTCSASATASRRTVPNRGHRPPRETPARARTDPRNPDARAAASFDPQDHRRPLNTGGARGPGPRPGRPR